MATSGSGTQTDPYIVDNWTDFRAKDTNGVYIKFANPSREITGNGTSGNPFVVSTYEEMLSKTGASYIQQVKLIDREAKKYKYNNGESDVYCIYDNSLTTIDFNEIQPGGYGESLTIGNATVDYNGWTFKNMTFLGGTMLRLYSRGKNLRLLNLLFNEYCNSTRLLMDSGFENIIIDMSVVSRGEHDIMGTGSDFSRGITNGSLSIRTTGNVKFYTTYLDNCQLKVDVSEAISFNTGYLNIRNTLVTGDIELRGTGSKEIFSSVLNSILDFNWKGNPAPIKENKVSSPSFFNSDKMPSDYMTASNLYAATTEQLKDAQWLYDHGFPIGVDS